jgi:hypothetical protein
LLSIKASTQVISIRQTEIDKYKIDKAGYKSDKGEYYGAGYSVDGSNMVVLFREILFDKKTNTLTLKGTTYSTVIDSASRLNGAEIFTAKTKRKKLKNRHVLGYSATGDSGLKKDGDFDISFQVRKNTNLFFDEGKNYYLIEYQIGDLVSSIK